MLVREDERVIVYQFNKNLFLHHALREDIEEVVAAHFRRATGQAVGPLEMRAWKHSLLEMAKVLQDEEPGLHIFMATSIQGERGESVRDRTGEDRAISGSRRAFASGALHRVLVPISSFAVDAHSAGRYVPYRKV